MANTALFTPAPTKTLAFASTTSSATAALPTTGAITRTFRIKNTDSTNVVFVDFGISTITAAIPTGATPGGMPIGPGETIGISPPSTWTHMAVIAAAGTPTVYVTPGDGI